MKQNTPQIVASLRQRVAMKLLHAISPALVACCLANQAQAAALPVPNGGFEAIFKPGEAAITADTAGGWTHGVGPGAAMDATGALATYSDATSGSAVDIPGWVNATGWPPSYDWPSGSGSVDGSVGAGHTYGTNGTGYSNNFGGAIQSAAALATVAGGEIYTLSADFTDGVSDRVLDLLADGVVLTPDTSTNPPGAGTYSRTYGSGSLAGLVGQSLTIRVGWAVGATGTQAHVDNVQLSSDAVSETTPPTLISFVDNKGGSAIIEDEKVTYTVTFSEAMNALTVDAADFENASATMMTVNSVTPTGNPAVFLVMATPIEAGTLQLQVAMGAALTDLNGSALVTTAAISDEDILTVNSTPPSTGNDITAFGANIAGSSAVITTTSLTTGTVVLTVPFGSTAEALSPTYTLSPEAICNQPNDGVTLPIPALSTTTPVDYVVTAEDSTSKTYSVLVNVTPGSADCDILTFGPGAVIDGTNITWAVLPGTTVEDLAPTYTLSPGATCTQPNDGVTLPTPAMSTTTPVEYVVLAEDGSTTKTYNVLVVVGPPESALIWNLASSGTWDTSTTNWRGQLYGFPMEFSTGFGVIFNNTAGGTISVTPNMAPGSTTVSAASGSYTFSGGAIAGSGGLTMSGGGTLVLNVANTYTGKTIVQAGTLALGIPLTNAGVAGPLGAPTGANATIDLHNGTTLQVALAGLTNPTTDRAINLAGTGSGTVSIKVNGADASCTFDAVTATGTGAKTLDIYPSALGNGGDRQSMIFKGAISDSSDSSPTSLAITFNAQTAAPSFVSLSGTNTFTGPITTVKQPVVSTGYLVIGGVRTNLINTPGSGTLGNGNYPGAIALDVSTILEYDSSAPQILAGAISGPGALQVTGSGILTLAGLNTYNGNTTVSSAGTLVLADTGELSFVVTDAASNKVTGAGTATMNGNFTIDTSAVSVTSGYWPLVDTATKSFGATFSVTDFTQDGTVWRKPGAGSQIWVFDTVSGKLSLNGPAEIVSFGIPGALGVIDQTLKTIALTVPWAPWGTALATLNPSFSVSSGACIDQTSGSPPSPTFAAGLTQTYTISDGTTTNPYSVTVTVTPVSTAKDILTFGIPGTAAVINGTNIVLTLPFGTDVTALAPTYTVSPLALQDALFPSGTARNFSTSGQTYMITAQDGSTKTYTATVKAGSSTQSLIGHWISGAASLSDTSGFTSAGTHDGVAVGTNAAALAWSIDVPAGFTGQSLDLSANNVAVQINNTATTDANYKTTFDEGIATKLTAAFWFKGPLAGTWLGKSGNTPQGWKTRPLSPKADFTMRSNSGESVGSSMTSANDVNDGNWHHIAAVFDGTASFRQIYVDGVLQKQVTGTPYAVTFSNLSHLLVGANQGNAANAAISSFFPGLLYDVRMYNYALSAAAVANVYSPGLIGQWVSGAENLVDTSGFTPPGTHDGVVVGSNAAALAWSSDVPAGFTGKSLDLRANNVAVQIDNTATTDTNYQTTFDEGIATKFTAAFWFKAPADSLVGTWFGKSGNTPWGWKTRPLTPNADFTMRNNSSGEPGIPSSMTSANTVTDGNWHHMAAVFDGTSSFRQVYIDGVLQNQVTGTPYVVTFNNLSHLVVGANQGNTANAVINSFFPGLLYDVRMYSVPLTAAEVAAVAGINYSTWATANAGGQPANQDYNKDGVQNGIAYFMGATGTATNPGLDATNKVTWPMSATFSGTYEVQTSPNLGTWTNVIPRPLRAGGNLTYTLPAGLGTQFVRLLVTPTP